jgi:hypothetical protein
MRPIFWSVTNKTRSYPWALLNSDAVEGGMDGSRTWSEKQGQAKLHAAAPNGRASSSASWTSMTTPCPSETSRDGKRKPTVQNRATPPPRNHEPWPVAD